MPRLYGYKGAAHSPKNLSMALSAEAAEIIEHSTNHGCSNAVGAGSTVTAQWLTEEQSKTLPKDKLAEVETELADTLTYLIRLSGKLDIDLFKAAVNKIEANEQKYPVDKARGNAKNIRKLMDDVCMQNERPDPVFPSRKMFGHEISAEQKKSADKTRKLVKERIGSWGYYKSLIDNSEDLTPEQRKKISTITTRGFQVQWVQGDTDKAETSFFNINMKGTPLDELEELLLRNRKKPVPIAARAIIRAGKGYQYWSCFETEMAEKIEGAAADLHKILFAPEIKRPVKTLDLLLGGSKGIRAAIQVLIDFILMSVKKQQETLPVITSFDDDITGQNTIDVLKKASYLASRITGNSDGSLGLHPAIYYYGPSGRHSSPMFLGAVSLVAEKLANNNSSFFKKFTDVREELEKLLISNKDLIAMILQKNISKYRVGKYHELLAGIISSLSDGNQVDAENIIKISKLEGKVLSGDFTRTTQKVSPEKKSKVFIHVALQNTIKCPICSGYLDTEKSVSYDHIIRVRDGGVGAAENIQLTHPYCNHSVKN